jgi:hypothetical protein
MSDMSDMSDKSDFIGVPQVQKKEGAAKHRVLQQPSKSLPETLNLRSFSV